jgi:hypothetical protein
MQPRVCSGTAYLTSLLALGDQITDGFDPQCQSRPGIITGAWKLLEQTAGVH